MAARRDPEMARRVRESLDLRGDKLAERGLRPWKSW